MIETEVSTEVKFYVGRMTDLFLVRDQIDKFPLDYYEELSYSQLRIGVIKGIFGTYRMLIALGEKPLADSMVAFDRISHERMGV